MHEVHLRDTEFSPHSLIPIMGLLPHLSSTKPAHSILISLQNTACYLPFQCQMPSKTGHPIKKSALTESETFYAFEHSCIAAFLPVFLCLY